MVEFEPIVPEDPPEFFQAQDVLIDLTSEELSTSTIPERSFKENQFNGAACRYCRKRKSKNDFNRRQIKNKVHAKRKLLCKDCCNKFKI